MQETIQWASRIPLHISELIRLERSAAHQTENSLNSNVLIFFT